MEQADVQALADIVHEEVGEAFKRTAARVKVDGLSAKVPWPQAKQIMVQVIRAMTDGLASTPDDTPPYDELGEEEQQVIRDIQYLSRGYRHGEGKDKAV